MSDEKATGLELLRKPFEPHQIGKLPKPTAAQTKAVKDDYKKGVRCQICGAWHHPQVVHLDYVGHAALTDRLLDCDPQWNWEPVAFNADGSPARDQNGGMWIRLTVCGVTRLGYGDADGKQGGSATKELIGDALRNAAMRFGAALDLWHKGDLHISDEGEPPVVEQVERPDPKDAMRALTAAIDNTPNIKGCDMAAFQKAHENNWNLIRKDQKDWLADRMNKQLASLSQKPIEDVDFGENAHA